MNPSFHRVSIEGCDSYDPDMVYAALKKALNTINFRIIPGKKVLLKPNIIAHNTPDQCTTTHPAVVGAVCRIFSEHDCSISIGDSSAFYQGGGTALGLETSGIADAAREYGARLIPFETTELHRVTTGKVLNPFYVTGAVFHHDLIVNMPKLKVHRLARLTGAIKNTYGCVVGGSKQVYHKLYLDRTDYREFWGKPLVDVYESINPQLTIMDAIIGLDKDGPAANGEPKKTGLVLASDSGAALDVVICKIIGFDPFQVPAVREALDRGIVSLVKIETFGDIPLIPYVKLPDEPSRKGLHKKLDDYIFDQFIVEPRVLKSKCKKCDECVNRCSLNAIEYNSKGIPVIDLKKCIYCYCCREYCPHGAIYLHGSLVNHIIRGIRYILKL